MYFFISITTVNRCWFWKKVNFEIFWNDSLEKLPLQLTNKEKNSISCANTLCWRIIAVGNRADCDIHCQYMKLLCGLMTHRLIGNFIGIWGWVMKFWKRLLCENEGFEWLFDYLMITIICIVKFKVDDIENGALKDIKAFTRILFRS